MKPKLSVIINTKNEEENIAECIKSVKNLASEIIVIDMESRDKTITIAKKLGVKIINTKDIGWVEPIRNFSINQAREDWILLLDADERIGYELKKDLKRIIVEDQYDVVKLPRKNIFFGQWLKHTGWWPDYQIRFFRKGFVRWIAKIHPQVRIRGRILELPLRESKAIVHYNAKTINAWLKKMDLYTSKETFIKKQEKLTADFLINRLRLEFISRYFHQKGFLDGLHGFVMSKFMEVYRFLEFVKFWEKKGFTQIFPKEELRKAVMKNDLDLQELKNLKAKIATYENVITDQEIIINKLKNDLDRILNSKAYKVWQTYCLLRDFVLGRK